MFQLGGTQKFHFKYLKSATNFVYLVKSLMNLILNELKKSCNKHFLFLKKCHQFIFKHLKNVINIILIN